MVPSEMTFQASIRPSVTSAVQRGGSSCDNTQCLRDAGSDSGLRTRRAAQWARQCRASDVKPAYEPDGYSEALVAHSVSMTFLRLLHEISANVPLSRRSARCRWASARSGVLWQRLFMGTLCEDWHTDWWGRRFGGGLGESVSPWGHFHECFMKELGRESTTFTSLHWIDSHTLGSCAGRHNYPRTTLEIYLDWNHLMLPI